MAEIDAAVLNVKLKYLDEDNAQRQKLADYYYTHINNRLLILPTRIKDEYNVYHQFPVFCERRNELQEYLKKMEYKLLFIIQYLHTNRNVIKHGIAELILLQK